MNTLRDIIRVVTLPENLKTNLTIAIGIVAVSLILKIVKR